MTHFFNLEFPLILAQKLVWVTAIHGHGDTVPLPLIRRIGGKINEPICIWEAAQTEFVAKIRIQIHKSRTNSYFDFFVCRRFFLVDSNLWDQFVFWGSVSPCLPMYSLAYIQKQKNNVRIVFFT